MAEKIVIVDDEKEIADVVELYLKNEDYEVHKFYNGKDTLAFLEKEEFSRRSVKRTSFR